MRAADQERIPKDLFGPFFRAAFDKYSADIAGTADGPVEITTGERLEEPKVM